MKISVSIDQIYSGHADAIYCLGQGRNATDLYSGSADGFIGTWDLASGVFKEPLAKMPATIYSIKIHPVQPILYVGLLTGAWFALNIEDRSIQKSIQLSTKGIFDLVVVDNGKYVLAASGEGFIYVIRTTDNTLVQSLNLTDKAIRSVEVSPCGKFIIAGASDHKMYFLKLEEKLVLQQVVDAHENSVFTATYKEGYVLLSGGRDAMLKQWAWNHDLKEWQIDNELPAHNYTINKISMNPTRELFATGSRDKTVKIWQSEPLELVKVLDRQKFEDAHSHSINTLLWLDDTTLLTAGDDRRIIRWQITGEK